jgi:hypothetical protein
MQQPTNYNHKMLINTVDSRHTTIVQSNNLVGLVTSASKLTEFVADTATYSTFLAAEEILKDGAKVCLICDKGASKIANAHSIKILAWYSRKEGHVRLSCLTQKTLMGVVMNVPMQSAIPFQSSLVEAKKLLLLWGCGAQWTDDRLRWWRCGKKSLQESRGTQPVVHSWQWILNGILHTALSAADTCKYYSVSARKGRQEKGKGILLHCLADDAWSV